MRYHDLSEEQVYIWIFEKILGGYNDEMVALSFDHCAHHIFGIKGKDFRVVFEHRSQKYTKIQNEIWCCLDFDAICDLAQIENLKLGDIQFSMCFGYVFDDSDNNIDKIFIDVELTSPLIEEKQDFSLNSLDGGASKCILDMLKKLKTLDDDNQILKATVNVINSKTKRKM